ncbi:MAG TPA: hypothetical protein VGO67_02770 [Verrucomicrobiae bacterium]
MQQIRKLFLGIRALSRPGISRCGTPLARSILILTVAFATQSASVLAEDVPIEASRWHLEMNPRTKASIETVTDHNGVSHRAIHFRVDYQKLSETQNYEPGTVYVPDVSFHNGSIEADLVGPIEPDDRTFVGIAFRIDPKNTKQHELIYFRPFNSGTERHLHTVQYVATDTIYDWPYLREKFPGKYESGATIANNVWFHARLEIEGTTVKVFVNGEKNPALIVNDLKLGDRSGMVGFWGYPGAFTNLKITKSDGADTQEKSKGKL